MGVELDVRHPVVLRPGEGEVVNDNPQHLVRLLLAHELLDVTWSQFGPREAGAVPHVHLEHTDSFYVLEGELTFRIGPDLRPVSAPAGTFAAVPPNVIHGFDNDGAERATFLNFHAPSGGFAAYMRGLAEGFDSVDPPADGGEDPGAAIVNLPGEGDRLRRKTSTLIKAQLPHIAAIELGFEPGWEGVDPHTHADHVDCFYVLDGNAEFVGAPDVWGPGTFAAAIPDTVHGFRLSGDRPLHVLNVHAPDTGFTDRLRASQG
jgi:quercetin dioxygenase-like cupin family protein